MAALAPETKIVRSGKVMSGAYSGGSGYVTLTLDIEGVVFKVDVHPETASKFHCGQAVTVSIATP